MKYIENLTIVQEQLESAFENNSEQQLLKILKENSFLFYELYERKFSPEPIFAEVPFGQEYRCDFAWLNDNSDGPEWVIVEIEKPKVRLFNKNGDPSAELNHAIEQVKSWKRYFEQYPDRKREIFGCVLRFRFVVVIGTREDWQEKHAAQWRAFFNKDEKNIEIRTMDVFWRVLNIAKNASESERTTLSFFMENPHSRKPSELKEYCDKNTYLQSYRNWL